MTLKKGGQGIPILENWRLVQIQDVGGEQSEYCLIGEVYGSKDRSDGKMMRTSKLTEFNLSENVVQTMNSTYSLGKQSQYSW